VSQESIPGSAPRTYRSALRQRQAEETRTRVVAAAAELFAADGYVRTTVARIAAAAGVSAETVQGQGPKAALLIAAVEHAAFGVIGESDIFELEAGRRLLAIDEREEALAFMVEVQTDVHERTARLATALIGAASMDPELGEYLDGLLDGIKLQGGRIVELLRDRGWLRSDVPLDELVETLVVLCSIETYLHMTQRDGWSATRYRGWLQRMLAETIFHTPQPN
jgi:AcrR family transcriptional regulator